MELYNAAVEVPRRTMVLFFVVDTSGSMYGSKIGEVNDAIREATYQIDAISAANADAQIKIATLEFSTGARWMESAPVPAEGFRWKDLNAGGMTDLGEACVKLNEKLSRAEFMSDITGSFAPAIFLLSDGEPTDDYKRGIEKLKENKWFNKAIKVAMAIGDDANQDKLAEFTGSREAVITVRNPEELRHWIKFVSVRASEIGSKSSNVSVLLDGDVDSMTDIDDTIVSKQDEFIKEIKQEMNQDAIDYPDDYEEGWD